jgi:hypothetical protein
MVNPHQGTSKAILKDIKKNGWTPKKGKLMQGATGRMIHHREGDKSRGRKGY